MDGNINFKIDAKISCEMFNKLLYAKREMKKVTYSVNMDEDRQEIFERYFPSFSGRGRMDCIVRSIEFSTKEFIKLKDGESSIERYPFISIDYSVIEFKNHYRELEEFLSLINSHVSDNHLPYGYVLTRIYQEKFLIVNGEIKREREAHNNILKIEIDNLSDDMSDYIDFFMHPNMAPFTWDSDKIPKMLKGFDEHDEYYGLRKYMKFEYSKGKGSVKMNFTYSDEEAEDVEHMLKFIKEGITY